MRTTEASEERAKRKLSSPRRGSVCRSNPQRQSTARTQVPETPARRRNQKRRARRRCEDGGSGAEDERKTETRTTRLKVTERMKRRQMLR